MDQQKDNPTATDGNDDEDFESAYALLLSGIPAESEEAAAEISVATSTSSAKEQTAELVAPSGAAPLRPSAGPDPIARAHGDVIPSRHPNPNSNPKPNSLVKVSGQPTLVTSVSAEPHVSRVVGRNINAVPPSVTQSYYSATPASALSSSANSNEQPANPVSRAQPDTLRTVAGKQWKDDTLSDFPANDFRIFVGNLAKEVTSEMLSSAFSRYQGFALARVVAGKGYGFVSFTDAKGFLHAMREKHGAYIGSKPVQLKKSNWQKRSASDRDCPY
jgi:hypothetical protein